MSHRRLAALAALLSLSALSCSESTGPDGASSHPLLVARGTAFRTLWFYTGTKARQITPDSVNVVIDVAAAPNGRLAFSTVRGSPARYAIIETAPAGSWLGTTYAGSAVSTSGPPTGLAFSPDGERLAWHAVTGSSDSIFVLDLGAAAPRALSARVLPQATTLADVRWTPAGRIAFATSNAIMTVDPANGDTTTIFTSNDVLLDYDFAPDGRFAVTTRPVNAEYGRLLVQQTAGSAPTPLGADPASNRYLVRWSPDGRRIATTTTDSTLIMGTWWRGFVPEVLSLAGARTRPRVGEVRVATLVGWTRDGRIVFTGGVPSPGPYQFPDVYTVLPAGSPVNVTRTPSETEEIVVIPR